MLDSTPAEGEQLFWSIVEELAADDLCAYGLWVHGKHPTLQSLAMSRHALLWSQLLETEPRLLMICPPEHGKTTVMRWHIEQWIGRQTEHAFADRGATRAPSALLVMNTATQAEKQSMAIAATIESNRRYQQLYPHVKPAPKWGWTKDTLYCQRPDAGTSQPDPTLQATGMFGPIQGARAGLCVVDDPTDQQDARSDRVLDAQKEWLQGTLSDRILEDGLMRAIMTPWSKKGVQQMYLDSDVWVSAVLPAIDQAPQAMVPSRWPESYPAYPWGHELWPDMWPTERLEKKMKEKQLVRDSGLWQLAWLCNPSAAAGNMFKRAWLQYADAPAFSQGVT